MEVGRSSGDNVQAVRRLFDASYDADDAAMSELIAPEPHAAAVRAVIG